LDGFAHDRIDSFLFVIPSNLLYEGEPCARKTDFKARIKGRGKKRMLDSGKETTYRLHNQGFAASNQV
jgi:hypothetical protein